MTNDPIGALDLTADGQKAFTELTRRIAERGAANATGGLGTMSARNGTGLTTE